MQLIVSDRVAWSVGLSVYLSIYHSSDPCKNGWTDWDAVWVVDSGGAEGNMCYMGAHWRHLANTTEPSVLGGDAALCQITLTNNYIVSQKGYHPTSNDNFNNSCPIPVIFATNIAE